MTTTDVTSEMTWCLRNMAPHATPRGRGSDAWSSSSALADVLVGWVTDFGDASEVHIIVAALLRMSPMTVHAALVLGGAAAGVAITLLLRRTALKSAEDRLRAVEQRAQLAEARARTAAEEEEARAMRAAAEITATTQRDADVTAVLERIRAEWSLAPKNASGRIDRELFKEYLLELHHERLTPATKPVFEQFLDRCFLAGVGLMLAPGRPSKRDLGRHCFSYVMLLAGEFYFEAAASAAGESCACSTPVLDQLALAPISAPKIAR